MKKNNKAPHREDDILPLDTGMAVRTLTKISEQICMLAEKETQALVRSDLVLFAMLQQEKEILSRRYAQASAEFRARLPEFKGADRALLERLEGLQKQIGEKTRANSEMTGRMHKRAAQNTQKTLVTAQELAQIRPVRLASPETQQEGV
jgi:hypothetical protein